MVKVVAVGAEAYFRKINYSGDIYIDWELVNHQQQKNLAVWVRKRKSNPTLDYRG